MDGGNSWTVQYESESARLNDVAFSDNLHGYAVGQSGQVVRTSDGGETWQETTESLHDLYFVEFVTSQHLFIIGRDSTVLETLDGGLTWNSRTDFGLHTVEDIVFVDSIHGWMVGIKREDESWNTAILRTSDAGMTWVSVIERGTFYYKLHALDQYRCVAFGYGAATLKTEDGGETWNTNNYDWDGFIYGLSSKPDGSGWVVGNDGTMLSTTDFWESIESYSRNEGDDFFDVDFTDSETGWAVGRQADGSNTVIWKTTNGGSTWECIKEDGWGLYRTVTAVSSQVVWVTGIYGTVFRSMDGGFTWEDLSVDTSDDFKDSHFFDESSGWIVSDQNLFKTTDGGQTFESSALCHTATVEAAEFFDLDTGWLIYYFRYAFRTTDGGATWDSVSLGYDYRYLRDIRFLNPQKGWILATDTYGLDAEVLLLTEDGGLSWTEKARHSGMNLRRLEFGDDLRGLAVGENGILITSDGGETWTAEYCPSAAEMRGIAFAGEEAWVVGDNGTIIHKDGIVHAPPSQSPLVPALFSIRAFPNPFNPETTIQLNLDQPQRIELSVFDITGRLVQRIAEGGFPAGSYSYYFNAASLPSGTYFARLHSSANSATTRLIVLK